MFGGFQKETDMQPTTVTHPPVDLAAVWLARVPVALGLSGLSKTHLYGAAKLGRIKLVKCGRSTLVDMPSLRAYVAALPTSGGAA